MTSQPEIHPLDQATRLVQLSDGLLSGHTLPAYGNMVGPFGGVIAATLLNAVLRHPDRQGAPLVLTVNFVAPITAKEFQIQVQPVRTNRSTQHWSMTLTQDEAVAATATAVFANRRDTWSATDAKCPDAPAWESLDCVPPVEGIAFTRCYEMRYIHGGTLGEGSSPGDPHSRTSLWMRDSPPRPLDFLSLAALCDLFIPRLFVRRKRIVPIGTVSMTAYFHVDGHALQIQGTHPVLGFARASHFGKGYHDQVAEIWGTGGILLATSHQIVYFKE